MSGMEKVCLLLPSGNIVHVAVAVTEEQRARGLAGLLWLAPDDGMLFEIEPADLARVWMKGCCIGLDVAWLDERGRVLHVVAELQPQGQGPFPHVESPVPAAWVLKMKGGQAAKYEVRVGRRILGVERLGRRQGR